MPFERSVRTLLELIKQSLRADTVTLTGSGERQEESDTAILLPLISPSFHLRIDWGAVRPDSQLTEIGPLIEALSLILSKIAEGEQLHRLMVEATNLEWELADSKIADRTAGLLASGAADACKVRQHVMRVLDPVANIGAATERINQLRAELADRNQIEAAKKLLQTRQRLTETEAYLHLRRASRRTRRTISELAREILGAEDPGIRRIA